MKIMKIRSFSVEPVCNGFIIKSYRIETNEETGHITYLNDDMFVAATTTEVAEVIDQVTEDVEKCNYLKKKA